MSTTTITSNIYASMISCGAANLKLHAKEVNDLNVFPIPDGDTGDNMLLTITGGANVISSDDLHLGETAVKIAEGMLLSARGNSGVITSQFFDGIACSLKDQSETDVKGFAKAFLTGVKHAYNAVVEPVEGTILTVAKEASEFASLTNSSVEEFLDNFLEKAKETLLRTPELLAVLKEAGVVDSGGAGLIYIVEGMRKSLGSYTELPVENEQSITKFQKIDLNSFTSDSVLEFGYCTEVLLRLMNAKTDPETFDVNIIIDYLKTLGNSVVAFKNGSIVKLHVHTMYPEKVFAFTHQYGEFLTVKVENMSLQHNSIEVNDTPKKKYAIIEIAMGEKIREELKNIGADYVIEGGQCMNPSTNDFIEAFKAVNAETIFVFPNNSNVILAAKQAAKLYDKSEIIIIESKTLGEGHAALTMFDPDKEKDEIVSDFYSSMDGVITAGVSLCSRESSSNGFNLKEGEYIGYVDKSVLAVGKNTNEAAFNLIDVLDFTDKYICIILVDSNVTEEEKDNLKSYIQSKHSDVEIYIVDIVDSIHNYTIILE